MKKNIFSGLFTYSDIRSWRQVIEKGDLYYRSNFYPEFPMEFRKEGLAWYYKVGRISNENGSILTLNKLGKCIWGFIIFLIISITHRVIVDTFYIDVNSKIYIFYLVLSYFLTYFVVSIFNWKIYKIFRKVDYAVNNVEKIKKQEENKILKEKIDALIEKKMSENPRLSRKNKIKKLEKKWYSF